MNIAFDSTAILGPMSKNRGIGNYALSQFTTMINMDKENSYFFINFFENIKLCDLVDDCSNLKEFYFDCGKNCFLIDNYEYKEVIGDIIKNFIEENKIDIFYITSPFDGHIHTYEKCWFKGVKTVATVYDIIPYVMKDIYLSSKEQYKWYMGCVDMLRWVDKYLVISQSVKDDMIKYLKFDENKIDVIWGAVDKQYRKIKINENDKKNLFSKFNIDNEYIMCTGGDDHRKNIEGLIISYSNIDMSLIKKYQLVVACKLSDSTIQKYETIIKKQGVSGRVILTNFVSSDELIKLYNLAVLMAFPSKYEGFGLPVVEAFACGTAVLTSNNSSLGQIADGAAILVDPFNNSDITRKLEEALTQTDLDDLINRGYEKLKKFQWNVVANYAIKSICSMKLEQLNNVKKRIAFFTPLPPIQSGISDYSVDILNAICTHFDIDVYIDDNYNVDCILNQNINIYNHKSFKKNCNRYYDIIYQVGNSEYHIYMWHYIEKYKGTVVLHDFNLHLVVGHYALYLAKNDYKLYRKYLLYDFNVEVVDSYLDSLKKGLTKIKSADMELNGFVTNYANKIIVHSNEAREKLLLRDIHRSVRTIPHYAKIGFLVNNEEIKLNMNIDNNTIIMASYGHIQETKRVIPILNAFNKLIKKYNNVKFIFVGKLDVNIRPSFESFLRDNEIEDKVSVTGYMDIDEFINYIDLADICFNLRYPYIGETSGSLMRILAKGKCVVVNDIGSFGEIPDECCFKLPSIDNMSPNSEVDAIYNAMIKLMQVENRINISKKARKFAENNLDLKVVAEQYIDFINETKVPSLTEEMLRNIIDNEINVKKYDVNEISTLSKTLGYSKNFKNELGINDEKVNVENIMSEIRRNLKVRGGSL